MCLATASGQSPVAIDESKIRATLQNESTVITVRVDSSGDHSVSANLLLEWLDRDEKASGTINRNISIAPGENTFDIPLPIESASIWTRLRYSLNPDRAEARAFPPLSGIVSLAHIASYIFEIKTSYAGVPQRGSPFTIYAQAVHPVTRRPVSGISWNAMLSIDKDTLKPVKTPA